MRPNLRKTFGLNHLRISTAVALAVFAFATVVQARTETGLLLHYDFTALKGQPAVVKDLSGRGIDGKIINSENVRWVSGRNGQQGQALELSGGNAESRSAPYIDVPPHVFEGVRAATIAAWIRWDGEGAFQWLYDLGADEAHGVFFTPNFGWKFGARGLIKQVIEDGEVGAGLSDPLPTGQWVHVATVIDGATLILYINGIEAGRVKATASLADNLTSPSATTSGYIGKAFWSHPFFKGTIDDFRIYDSVLPAAKIIDLMDVALPVPELTGKTIDVTATVGMAPALPQTLKTTFSDGISRSLPVTWPAASTGLSAGSYDQIGDIEIAGTVAGYNAPVTARIHVRAPQSLIVDLAKPTGAFHGGASGTLYGLYDENLPSDNLVEGINLRTVSTKAQDGVQHPGADALEVAKLLSRSSGGDTYIYMTDAYRHFPYQWKVGSCADSVRAYMEKIRTQVRQVLSLDAAVRSRIVFVPWNEPEGNMFGYTDTSCNGTTWQKAPEVFFAAWDESYRTIKALMPDARIAGPNTSILFNEDKLFLQHAVKAGTVPDVMTWHELSNPSAVRSSVERYRNWETEVFAGTPYAGRHLPININEYAYNYHTSVPGQMIQWISAIEDMKVDADIAYWNIDGNLSDSAVESNRGNGQWWLLNAYAGMSGQTVSVTPPQPNESYTLQGLATFDASKSQARVLLGGGTGKYVLDLQNVSTAVFGPAVHVTIREIGWTGQLGDSGRPPLIADFVTALKANIFTLTFGEGELPQLKEESAYEVIISPAAGATTVPGQPARWEGRFEAEAAAHSGDGYVIKGPEGSPDALDRFHTSGGYSVGGFSTGSDVTLDFAVNLPEDGAYRLSVLANTFNRAEKVLPVGATNVFMRVDDKALTEAELLMPLGYKPSVWSHTDTVLHLTQGAHRITLSTRGLNGRTTQGDALIDRLTLSLVRPEYAEESYEAENAWLDRGQPEYTKTKSAAALKAGGRATFWVYAPNDAPARLSLDILDGDDWTLAVNGQTLGQRKTATVFLSGGVNKVEVVAIKPVLIDRLRVMSATTATMRAYQAEDATLSGTARTETLSLAQNGKAVTGIGGAPGNDNRLSFNDIVVSKAGLYALTITYSNEEQAEATHYNPDPLARRASLAVNRQTPINVTFPHSFHQNNFWKLTLPVNLAAGKNTLVFSAEEKTDFDGRTYASGTWPEVLLRSKYAPNIDQIEITPYVQ